MLQMILHILTMDEDVAHIHHEEFVYTIVELVIQ